MGDVARGGPGIDAANEQPLASTGGEQFERIGDARGAAGEHDDAVGIAVEHDLFVGHQGDEADEAKNDGDAAEQGEPDGKRPEAPRGDSGVKAEHRRARPPRQDSLRRLLSAPMVRDHSRDSGGKLVLICSLSP